MINLIDVDGGFLNIRLDARHFVALFLKALCHNESYPIPYYQQVTQKIKKTSVFLNVINLIP